MAKRTNTGDVHWTLPGKKRPFAYSTKATSDLIVLFSEGGKTVREAKALINFDDEAKDILDHFINAGYGETRLNELVR